MILDSPVEYDGIPLDIPLENLISIKGIEIELWEYEKQDTI